MNNNMKKRGLSPLISWILIVAFSVVVGTIVIVALIDNTKHILPKDNLDYCQDVRISLMEPNVYRNNNYNGTLVVLVKNTGSFSIQKLTIGRTTSEKAEQWCEYSNFVPSSPLKPGAFGPVYVNLDQNYYLNITSDSFTQCNTSYAPNSTLMVAQIELVPWIKIDDNLVQCNDKKMTLKDSTALNIIK